MPGPVRGLRPATMPPAPWARRHSPPQFSPRFIARAAFPMPWMSAVFNKYASKPAARHASRMTSSPYAVRAIKYGRPDESASRSRRARSSPVMSCKERSRIAQSGWKILAIESAVRPSAAAATSCPINSTKRTMSPLTSSLSSTTRTFLDRWPTALRLAPCKPMEVSDVGLWVVCPLRLYGRRLVEGFARRSLVCAQRNLHSERSPAVLF